MKYLPYLILFGLAGVAAYLYWQKKNYSLNIPVDEITVRRARTQVS